LLEKLKQALKKSKKKLKQALKKSKKKLKQALKKSKKKPEQPIAIRGLFRTDALSGDRTVLVIEIVTGLKYLGVKSPKKVSVRKSPRKASVRKN
jgi:hypothetical protein